MGMLKRMILNHPFFISFMNIILKFCAVLVFSLTFASFSSAKTLNLSEGLDDLEINSFLEYLEDSTGLLSFEQVSGDQSSRFTPVHRQKISSGLSGGTFWFRLRYQNWTDNRLELVLRTVTIANPSIKAFNPRLRDNGIVNSGAHLPMTHRPINSSIHGLPITFPTGVGTLYWRVSSLDPLDVQFRLQSKSSFDHSSRKHDMLASVFLAFTLCLLGYTGFLALCRRSFTYLTIFGFCGLSSLSLMGSLGLVSFWVNDPLIDLRFGNSFTLLALATLFVITPKLIQKPRAGTFKELGFGMAILYTVFGLYSLHSTAAVLTPAAILLSIAAILALVAVFYICHTSRNHFLYGFYSLLLTGAVGYFSLMAGLINNVLLAFWFINLCALSSMALLIAGVKKQRLPANDPKPSVNVINASEIQWRILQKINHDLRTPINGLLGMSELLSDTNLSANQYEYVQTIQSAGVGLLNTADQIKSLSRIVSEKMVPEISIIHLADFLHETTQPFARLASVKNVELVTDISYQVPVMVKGDKPMLRQILNALLENAIKFTDRGEVLVQVSKTNDGKIRFRITDTGSGIHPDRIPHLFEFEQASGNRVVCLGLPIAQRLTKSMGGELSVSSEHKQGTTFWFSIDLPAVITPQETLPNIEQLNKLRVLIVDDNLTCRKVMEHQASTWGVEVDTVASGQEALALLHTQFHLHHGYDVVILDHQMPTMDGTQLAQKIKNDNQIKRELILIMMTGLDLREQDEEVKQAGIHYLLTKPVSARQLQKALLRAIPNLDKRNEAIYD